MDFSQIHAECFLYANSEDFSIRDKNQRDFCCWYEKGLVDFQLRAF